MMMVKATRGDEIEKKKPRSEDSDENRQPGQRQMLFCRKDLAVNVTTNERDRFGD